MPRAAAPAGWAKSTAPATVGWAALVMELMAGQTVAERIAAEGVVKLTGEGCR